VSNETFRIYSRNGVLLAATKTLSAALKRKETRDRIASNFPTYITVVRGEKEERVQA
jgi:hypothetical protein